MKFAAVLGVVALLPIAFVAGYFLHQEPGMPGFNEYAVEEMGVRHVPGEDSDDWLAAAITGPYKGNVVPVEDALGAYRTHKDLEAGAQGKVRYYEVRCKNYSSGGDKALMFTARSVLRKCSASEKTRRQVEKYVAGLTPS